MKTDDGRFMSLVPVAFGDPQREKHRTPQTNPLFYQEGSGSALSGHDFS